MYGADDKLFRISYTLNDAFIPVKSHAAEVEMLQVYSQDGESGSEGDIPYIAIQEDDDVYGGVALFEETGRVDDAYEVIPLSGMFMFKAKMEYYGDVMYFYGYKRCGDPYQCSGLCLVYPKEYIDTENERLLMRTLDEAAESYTEELFSDSSVVSEPMSALPNKTLKTVVKTVTIINRIRIIAGIAVIAVILIYLLIANLSDKFSVHHIVQLDGSEKIISEFTPDEVNDILSAFDIVISANEENAKLVSFIRGDRYDKIASYIIEIDGINDYNAFFAANSDRGLGRSVNEADTRNTGTKYYITYHERIVNGQKSRDRSKNAEAYNHIVALFEKLYSEQ